MIIHDWNNVINMLMYSSLSSRIAADLKTNEKLIPNF